MVFTGIGRVRPGPHDLVRNPAVCVILTAAVTTTCWLGLIWLASRVVG